MEFFVIAVGVFLVGGTIYIAFAIFVAGQYQHVHASRPDQNDGETVEREFIRLLDDARREFIVYDDGNRVPDSIYDSEKVVKRVRKKLDTHPKFQLRCLFNYDVPDLKFRQAFSGSDSRVEIKILEGENPRAEPGLATQYKVIDKGAKAYLSWHQPSSTQRTYQMIDCSGVLGVLVPYVAREVVGKYRTHFNREFRRARAAA